MISIIYNIYICINYLFIFFLNSLTYQENNGIIQFRETDIMEFTSKYPEPVFLVDFINEIEVQDTG